MLRRPWAYLALILVVLPRWSAADARSEFLTAAENQQAKHWDEAAQGYARVTALSPSYAPAWKQLATCRYFMNDLEGAEASAGRYLKLQPDDSSFAAWDGQLRKKLNLPPLDLAPVTTPIPTQVPVATPESALIAVPAPEADAEIMTDDAAALAAKKSNGAAVTIAEVDPHASETSFGGENSNPSPTPSKIGLRLLGAFSLGLGKFSHGEAVNSSTLPSNQGYNGQPGLGLGGVVELIYLRNSSLELSLGLYPIQWQETQRSDQTSAVTRSNESSASALFLPVLLGLGWRNPLGNGMTGILSVGLGAVPSASVEVTSQTVQTQIAGLQTTTFHGTYNFGMGPAYRLSAGIEFPLSPHAAFFVGGQLLGATFADTQGTENSETVDASGTVVASTRSTGVSKSLSLLSSSALAGLTFSY